MPSLVRGLVLTCHPGPCVAVTAFATALAVSVGLASGRVVLVAAAILTGQLSIGWLNDYVDREVDRAATRADKPLSLGLVRPEAVRAAMVVAAALCVVLSLALGWRAGLLHLLTVGSAYSYDLWLKPTIWSPVPFVVSFGLLPAVVTLALARHPWPPASLFVAGAALGCAAHLANTVKDTEADAVTGVRGFPQRIGPRPSLVLAAGLVAVGAVVIGLGRPDSALTWVLAAAAVGAALTAALVRRAFAFAMMVLAAGLLVVAAVIAGAGVGA